MLGSSFIRTTVAVAAALAAMSASAAEYPIGKQQIQGGMEIGAVYLQPITMDPEGMMRKASDSDIHLEADIHAVKNNPTGFAEGDWMPYLQVTYKLTKQGDTKWKAEGDLMGMVASDGPHYGDNVKLNGGQVPPDDGRQAADADGPHGVRPSHRQETGVGAWFKPITLEYDFPFAGIGKKGGY